MRFLVSIFAILLLTVSSASAGDPQVRLDGDGDPLPTGAIARLGTTRYRLPRAIAMLTAVPDQGELAVACMQDKIIRMVDVTTGKIRDLGELSNFPLSDLQRRYSGLAYSAKHRLLCVLRSGGVDAMHIETGKIAWSYTVTTNFFGMTPNGEYLLVMERNRVLKLVNVVDGSLKTERDVTRVSQLPLAMHPTRPIVTIGSNEANKPKFWHWNYESDTEEPGELEISEPFQTLAYSDDGKSFTATDAVRQLIVFDLAARKIVSKRAVESNYGPRWMAFSRDRKKVLYIDHGSQLHLYDAEKSDAPAIMISGGETSFSIPAIYDERRIYGKVGGTVVGWDTTNGAALDMQAFAHTTPVVGLHVLTATNADETVASIDYSGDLAVWRASSGKLVRKFERPAKTKTSIPAWDVSLCGKKLLWRYDPTHFRLFDFAELLDPQVKQPKFREFVAPADALRSYLDGDGNRVGAFSLSGLNGWYRTAGENAQELLPISWPDFTSTMRNIYDLDSDFRHVLATIGNNSTTQTLCVLEAETGKILRRFNGKDGTGNSLIQAAEFVERANWILEVRTTGVRIWDVDSGKAVWQTPTNSQLQGGVSSGLAKTMAVDIDDDGRFVAWYEGGTKRQINIFDLLTGSALPTIPMTDAGVRSLRLTVGERPLLTTGHEDGNIYTWSVPAIAAAMKVVEQANPEFDELWKNLASSDPLESRRAGWAIAAAGEEGVRALSERIQIAAIDDDLDAKSNAALAALDAPEFADRETATRTLYEFGETIVPLLNEALSKTESQEVRARLRILLRAWQAREIEYAPDELRVFRAIAILREIGGKSATELLRKIESGNLNPEATIRARAAIRRIAVS